MTGAAPPESVSADAKERQVLDILRMDITKELLRKMAKEERCLFLALGRASIQVNALWKLVIVLTNGGETDSKKQRLEAPKRRYSSGSLSAQCRRPGG